ncbi:unnamed protein product [Cylindrotheca closterium]|uniref:Uncharacterized protein n=1 Tax=Cylindrotheca closterium TaxID=2856 RepID=A0AAD2CN44_9STRA|nr:unnamed protein product [Cylindrotheca closterium]
MLQVPSGMQLMQIPTQGGGTVTVPYSMNANNEIAFSGMQLSQQGFCGAQVRQGFDATQAQTPQVMKTGYFDTSNVFHDAIKGKDENGNDVFLIPCPTGTTNVKLQSNWHYASESEDLPDLATEADQERIELLADADNDVDDMPELTVRFQGDDDYELDDDNSGNEGNEEEEPIVADLDHHQEKVDRGTDDIGSLVTDLEDLQEPPEEEIVFEPEEPQVAKVTRSGQTYAQATMSGLNLSQVPKKTRKWPSSRSGSSANKNKNQVATRRKRQERAMKPLKDKLESGICTKEESRSTKDSKAILEAQHNLCFQQIGNEMKADYEEHDAILIARCRQMYMVWRLAEGNCHTTSSGKVPWSPKLQGFWDRLSLWKLLLKGRKRCRVSSQKVRRLMEKTRLCNVWKQTTDELEEALAAERRAYKQAKHQATQLRRDFLTAQTKYAKKKKWKSQKAHDRFLRLRQMKQQGEARRRRRAQQKGSTGGLQAIQIEEKLPDGTTRLCTITDRALLEEGCMQENAAQYEQTRAPYTTPPMVEPLYTAFTGVEAESNSIALLEGRYSLPDLLDPATTAFLSHCQFHKGHFPVHLEVTTSDHVYFWSWNPEDKGSEPHGLHNGHFKAAAQSPVIASNKGHRAIRYARIVCTR